MASEQREALLSVAQAAALLGVHPNTIRSWTDAGRLTAYRINARGDRRFRRDDVEGILVEDGHLGPAGEAPRDARDRTLAVFTRLARGFESAPTTDGVARTLVEAIRADLGAARAAIYATDVDDLELAAHAGFASPPAARRPIPNERSD
ncbi:MAG: helix-turn-helix domain-containing protein, partial [Candidatus Limnocylindria bacterium]